MIAHEVGPGDLRLVAFVVSHDGEDITASELRKSLRRQLPEYMIPLIIVTLNSIPLTPNGKVDRKALPDPFANVLRTTAPAEPPAPGMEQLIAEIWKDLLKVETIGAEDNFFELGGHSLLSLRVASLVEKRTGWRMDPRALFFQNLRQIAANVESKTPAPETLN